MALKSPREHADDPVVTTVSPLVLSTRPVPSVALAAVVVAAFVAVVVAGLLVAARPATGEGDVPGRTCPAGGDRLAVVAAGGAPCR